eukprot:TRINITY_DN4695_c0_g1_i2.p1 TRINITY_DN4695_c0_g1~~TRINITY_DN4695_c0_g1_i2.p1  ORF type:complete len:186 (-),score=41.92 TRINITY_DN4695_c0_g1_i2:123-638(-)
MIRNKLLITPSKYAFSRLYSTSTPKPARLHVGQCEVLKKVFDVEEVKLFSQLSTDSNPIHLDKEYASTTRFKHPIVHGLLTASLLSAVVGTKLPGEGSIYVKQVLNFKAPVFVGDEVTATVTVKSIEKEKKFVTMSTVCTVVGGKGAKTEKEERLVIDGEAVIYIPHLSTE